MLASIRSYGKIKIESISISRQMNSQINQSVNHVSSKTLKSFSHLFQLLFASLHISSLHPLYISFTSCSHLFRITFTFLSYPFHIHFISL